MSRPVTDPVDNPTDGVASPPIGRRTVMMAAGAGALAFNSARTSTASAAVGARPTKLTTIVLKGRVITAEHEARPVEAVAIGVDGTIVDVGSTQRIRRLAGSGTEVIDARGGTVMPGIHDGHMHPLGAATQGLNPSLRNATFSVPELQAALRTMLTASADQEPDGWLQVTNWNPVGLTPAGTVASKALLDSLPTRRPIFLQGSDFHNSLANSRALALAGVSRTTADPAGGQIVRDSAGEATGLLKDNAQGIVSQQIPAPSEARVMEAYRAMAALLLSKGITSFLDAASGEETIRTYRDLIGKGLVPQQVTPALLIDADLAKTPRQAADYLRDLRKRYRDTRGVSLTTAKVFLDG
jgi:predicted amidohydrolase YtcJ